MKRCLLWFASVIGVICWAKPPSNPIVLGSRNSMRTINGVSYSSRQFWVFDPQTRREFAVSISHLNGVWVGPRVWEHQLSLTVEQGGGSHLVPANREDSVAVLSAINQGLSDGLRPHHDVYKPSPESDQKSMPASAGQNTRMNFSSVPLAVYSTPSTQDYNRQRFVENFNYTFANQMAKSQFGMERHLQQQEALRMAEQAARDEAKAALDEALQSSKDSTSRQQAELLYLFYIAQNEVPTPSDVRSEGDEKLTNIILDDQGLHHFLDLMSSGQLEKDWQQRAEVAAILTNPWSGIPGGERTQFFADAEGVLVGPLIKRDTLKISRLAKRDPVTAFELTRAANALQAYAQERPYLFKISKNKSLAESAVILLRMAAASGNQDDVSSALAMVNFFTGHVAKANVTVTQQNGIRKFAIGGSLNDVIRSTNGEKAVSQAVYNQMVTSLSWLEDLQSPSVITRPWGDAISMDEAMVSFLSSSVENPKEWLNNSRQSYPLPAPNELSSVSPETKNFLMEISGLTTSAYSAGPTALAGAFSAAKTADDLFISGDRENGERWLQYGRMMADVALGFVPVVGSALDLVSVVTGTNLITGEELTTNERVIAGASLLTFGVGREAVKIWDGLRAARVSPVLTKAIHQFESIPTNELNRLLRENRNYTEFAWRENARAWKFTLPEASKGQFSRVYASADSMKGSWIVETKLVEGKSAEQIAQILRLPERPAFISEVVLPKGAELIRGPVNFRAFDNGAEKTIRTFGDKMLELKPERRTQYFVKEVEKIEFINQRNLP